MFTDYFGAVLLIVFAEMGDKTQFLAMAFATKYPVKKILLGVAIGAFFNHGLAMILGRALMQLMPGELISFIAGLMFVFFAFQSLVIDDEDPEESKTKYGAIITVALAFFIGELGDKTQLAALGLSVDSTYMLAALMGTVTGMVITSALGIYVGLKLGKKIPEDKLKLSAFLIFMLFGLQKLYSSYGHQLKSSYLIFMGIVILGLSNYACFEFLKKYRLSRASAFKRQAERLKNMTQKIELQVINMCKGPENCGVCDGTACLVGYMKNTIKNADKPIGPDASDRIGQLKNKNFDLAEAKKIMTYLLDYYDQYPSEFENNKTLKVLRQATEMIVLKKMVTIEDYEAYKESLKSYFT